MNYSNLGEGSVENFSNDSSNNNLNFTDYKQAHTKTMLINTNNIKRKNYSSVEELETAREKINYQMSEEDMRKDSLKKDQLRILEEERLKRLQKKDLQIENQYHQINNLMLN